MLGLLRLSLLLVLLFGVRPVKVQADEVELSAAPREALTYQTSLVLPLTTLRLERAGALAAADPLLALPSARLIAPTELALHAGPSERFPSATVVPTGAELSLRSMLGDGSWAEVEWQGQCGWVPTESLSLHKD